MIWIGVDAHKEVHQAIALSEDGVVGELTIPNTAAGWASLLDWASRWPERIWQSRAPGTWGEGWRSIWREPMSACTK